MTQPTYRVSDFVAVCNQVMDMSFGLVSIVGEMANFRVSKNRWVYFDLKDDYSSVKFFCSVYALPGPLEDGMMLVVHGNPGLHPKFGFSITAQSIQLEGEGTIKKAANLLEAKLEKEGLFAEERKRSLPAMPETVGLITSVESAAHGDFIKVVSARWGINVLVYDVQVQGENAVSQIVRAVDYFSKSANPPEVIVLIRGGGSADDLQAFSTESVTRAVAGSRIPTLVAIGHERDVSLAERAADKRASTPSNAAEILVPDKKHESVKLRQTLSSITHMVSKNLEQELSELSTVKSIIKNLVTENISTSRRAIQDYKNRLELLNPDNVLRRGYAIVHDGATGTIITSARKLKKDQHVELQFKDGKKSTNII